MTSDTAPASAQRNRRSRGQSLVELTLVLPLLTLAFVLAVDFGRAFYYQVAITSAAREGARAAAIPTNDVEFVRSTAISEVMSTVALQPGDVDIEPASGRSSGESVTVTVYYDFAPMTPLLANALSQNGVPAGKLRLQASSVAVVQ